MEGPKLTRERLAKAWGTLVTNTGESCPENYVVDLIIDGLVPVGQTRGAASHDL
jgi:hypothetical protein